MQKRIILAFLLFLLCFSLHIAAQEEDDQYREEGENEVEADSDYSAYMPSLYSPGDQVVVLSPGMTFPLGFFLNDNGKAITNNAYAVAGAGSVTYSYFLSSNWFVGGEIGGSFDGTIGENMLYIVPITIHSGYQFVFGRVEVPMKLSLGIAPQTHLNNNYLGFFAKPGVSVFFRFNPDWSFGINTAWWIVPEWGTNDTSKDVTGHFFELTLAVRHHF